MDIPINTGISIGIVTAIAAPASIKVDFEGGGGHAGAVLMPHRWVYMEGGLRKKRFC